MRNGDDDHVPGHLLQRLKESCAKMTSSTSYRMAVRWCIGNESIGKKKTEGGIKWIEVQSAAGANEEKKWDKAHKSNIKLKYFSQKSACI